jgi:hypothetical protein
MLYAVGSPLPEHRIKAYNNGDPSINRIHDDEYARRHGFRAALVPGISLFAHMSRSLVDFMGRDWLERGSAEMRFIHPVYDGEEVRVAGCLTSILKNGTLLLNCQLLNNLGVECVVGSAGLPPMAPQPEPSLEDYPPGAGQPKRTISLETLNKGECLTPITAEFTRNIQWEYCQKSVRDHSPIYQQVTHPGWLLSQANLLLAANYELGAWMHVASALQNYHLLEKECVIETRGLVQDMFERRGHHFIVLDVAIFAAGGCLETIRHTAIFRIAPKAA